MRSSLSQPAKRSSPTREAKIPRKEPCGLGLTRFSRAWRRRDGRGFLHSAGLTGEEWQLYSIDAGSGAEKMLGTPELPR